MLPVLLYSRHLQKVTIQNNAKKYNYIIVLYAPTQSYNTTQYDTTLQLYSRHLQEGFAERSCCVHLGIRGFHGGNRLIPRTPDRIPIRCGPGRRDIQEYPAGCTWPGKDLAASGRT